MYARGNVVRVDAQDLLELRQRFGVIAFVAASVGELEANVDEGRAQPQRAPVFADRLIEHSARGVDVADLRVHVGDLPLDEGVDAPRRAALSRQRPLVDLLRLAVLP